MNDPDLRAAETEAQMSDDERFGLLHGHVPLPLPGLPPVPPHWQISSGRVSGVPRLGVPDLAETDASLGIINPLGLRPGDTATAMPAALALAASFNPELAEASGAMLGAEARSKGFNVLLGGGINLARDFYGGRNFEYLGEDPLLAGVLAAASVRGTQSRSVIATVKHLSLNAQETLRETLDARIDEAAHRESDLLAFRIAVVEGQPGSVMGAYNRVNGEYACGSRHLLTDVLKRDWGFRGWTMSDWGAVHGVDCFAAGLDQQSGAVLDREIWFDAPLRAEIAAGRVPRERLSDAVRRILRSIYAVGADRPQEPAPLDLQAHARIAREVALQGAVLLKNDGVLPLSPQTTGEVLLVGGHAHLGVLSGNGSSQVMPHCGIAATIPAGGPDGFGARSRQLYFASPPMKALAEALPEAKLVYDSGYVPEAAAARAARAALVVVFATQWHGEGLDGASLALPQGQDMLIDALARANPCTLVVLQTGNPVAMPWLDRVRAVLQVWYPGQEGGAAIAALLTGSANPSGRLPITFPRRAEHAPRLLPPGLGLPAGSAQPINYSEGADVGYRWYARRRQRPLFAFGHGLSYTSFEHGRPELAIEGGELVAHCTVRNSGERAGAEVLQLYLLSAAGTACRRLVGFARVPLAPGEQRRLALSVRPHLLADWTGDGWTLRRGSYRLALGRSAIKLGRPVSITLPQRQLPA